MRKSLLPATAGLLALSLAGCSSSSDTAESPAATQSVVATENPADTATPMESPTATDTAGSEEIAGCDAANLGTYLPTGSVVNQVECATVGDTVWAAALVMEGPTVFYLTRPADDDAASWSVRTGEEVCGSASAGLPPRLLAFCEQMASPATS